MSANIKSFGAASSVSSRPLRGQNAEGCCRPKQSSAADVQQKVCPRVHVPLKGVLGVLGLVLVV